MRGISKKEKMEGRCKTYTSISIMRNVQEGRRGQVVGEQRQGVVDRKRGLWTGKKWAKKGNGDPTRFCEERNSHKRR